MGALVGSNLTDLLGHAHRATASAAPTHVIAVESSGVPGANTSRLYFTPSPAWITVVPAQQAGYAPDGALPSAAQWWRSTPALAVAFATIVLLIAAAIAARRRRGFVRPVGGLVGAAALVALIGGPLAALVAMLAPMWVGGDWVRTPMWPQALVWALIGSALLAVRQLLARTTELRTELDGVI
ncbi:MAG TPA: hypothetical protein VKB59_23565 [Micromonosporaceae bacterium]|nr:hypothetical protein [Micromonosporaceae bacterium]